MSNYSEAQKRVMLASFEVGQAQRALEEAENRFKKALEKLESLEGLEWPALSNGERA
ncbi:hypothetical protein ABIE85_001462 [Bradyrhizobium diazoefficiens]|uniref:hypothetical protein n=1 Tax=Bradyrhizobium diazoefficiens TaxID=1355477 RepID=UPI00272C560D|nr:hypothetical protein [Bradyrhizobium diazoefficiens]WLA60275.1 hypothetical protein QIH81_16900 [Bradyrhizobium diazoefficiens]